MYGMGNEAEDIFKSFQLMEQRRRNFKTISAKFSNHFDFSEGPKYYF